MGTTHVWLFEDIYLNLQWDCGKEVKCPIHDFGSVVPLILGLSVFQNLIEHCQIKYCDGGMDGTRLVLSPSSQYLIIVHHCGIILPLPGNHSDFFKYFKAICYDCY